jgi:hypothetical protein
MKPTDMLGAPELDALASGGVQGCAGCGDHWEIFGVNPVTGSRHRGVAEGTDVGGGPGRVHAQARPAAIVHAHDANPCGNGHEYPARTLAGEAQARELAGPGFRQSYTLFLRLTRSHRISGVGSAQVGFADWTRDGEPVS